LSSNNYYFKKVKVVLAKSTSALTCLLSLLIISRASAQNTTVTASMIVSTIVGSSDGLSGGGSSCSVSASNMDFAPYAKILITATSVVSANCTNGTTYNISFNDSPNDATAYYLVRTGGNSATASDRLNVIFTNTAGATMTNGAATISGTGIGSSATAGTITGTIAANQTGKTAGSYLKTMTLNIVYNSNPIN